MSSRSVAPSGVRTQEPSSETLSLRKEIKALLELPLAEVNGLKVGQVRCGAYAFFDYDDEPIYVGQTLEKISTRIRRHLTNQRTDAVAMSVLDPFEVYKIRIWPLPQFQKNTEVGKVDCIAYVNRLETSIYHYLLKESRFGAVLNEKTPTGENLFTTEQLPLHYERVIVSDQVKEIRGHPDIRLARRAQTIARLAQIISEREPSPGLRRTLLVQANRLEWLANERFQPYQKEAETKDKEKADEEID